MESFSAAYNRADDTTSFFFKFNIFLLFKWKNNQHFSMVSNFEQLNFNQNINQSKWTAYKLQPMKYRIYSTNDIPYLLDQWNTVFTRTWCKANVNQRHIYHYCILINKFLFTLFRRGYSVEKGFVVKSL